MNCGLELTNFSICNLTTFQYVCLARGKKGREYGHRATTNKQCALDESASGRINTATYQYGLEMKCRNRFEMRGSCYFLVFQKEKLLEVSKLDV